MRNYLLLIIIFFYPNVTFSNDTFESAFKNALINSNEIKQSEFIIDSKKKLLLSSYKNQDWSADFTSSITLDNKRSDNSNGYVDQNINLNTILLKKNLLDFGITDNLVNIANNNIKIARNDLKILKQKLFIETLTSYLDLYNSNKIIRLRESNVKRFKTAVKAAKLKLSAGSITPTTVSEAEARLARSEYELALSKTEKTNIENNFNSLVGNTINLKKLSFPEFKGKLTNTIEKTLKLSIKYNLKLSNIKLKKENAFLLKQKQKFSNNPSLDLNFHIKNSEDYSNKSTNDFTSYGSSITFKTSLYDGNSEKNLILSLDDEYKALVMKEKEILRKLKLNSLSIFNNYKNSEINVNAATKEFNAAKLALLGIKKEEEFGLRTLLEVLDSEVDVIDSELKILTSKSNQIINKYKLLIDIGNLKF